MSMAFLTALRSSDPSTKIGAVIIDKDLTVVSTGYNGMPRGMEITDEQWNDKDFKYKMVVHAEANAIFNAGRQGKSLKDTTLFLNWFPCLDCMKIIVQSGITDICYYRNDSNVGKWQYSFADALRLAEIAGLKLRKFEGQIPNLPLFRSGEILMVTQ